MKKRFFKLNSYSENKFPEFPTGVEPITFQNKHKNLVYDFARHDFSIDQWLGLPAGILEGHGSHSH